MKVKNFLFVTFFLSTASLGLAHPSAPKNVTTPSIPASTPSAPKNVTTPSIPDNTQSAPIPSSPASDVQVQSVLAKAVGTISKECTAAIFTIVSSPEFLKCVGVTSLLPLVPLITDPTILPKFIADPVGTYVKTVEQPLVQFATIICGEPKCSDDAVDGAIKLLQQGCQKDLSNPLIQLLFDVTVFYSPLRDITCFKDKKQFCFDESMLTITKLPPSPFKITGNNVVDSIAVADPNAICTNCNKDIVNTIFNFLKKGDKLALDILTKLGIDDKKIQEIKLGVAVKCGIKFEDGTTP